MSFESWAEIYNEVNQGSTNAKWTRDFFNQQPLMPGSGWWLNIYSYLVRELATLMPLCSLPFRQQILWGYGALTRKHVAEAFWNNEVESEVRGDHNLTFRFTEKTDCEAFMDMVDQKRATTPYPHTNCSEECKKRGIRYRSYIYRYCTAQSVNLGFHPYTGCGTLWSLDGNWKLHDLPNMHVPSVKVHRAF